MAITIKDIANVCNVSFSTVSRVLNGKHVRDNETSRKVIATAQALGYSPNNVAVRLVKKSSNVIGFLVPDIANPHYSEITKSINDIAFSQGLQVFLCNTEWDVAKEKLYRDSLLEQRVAGLIVMPVCDQSHAIFSKLSIPVVMLGSRTEEADISYVVMDNTEAARLATEVLIQNGFHNLVFLSRAVPNITMRDRVVGFTQALQAHRMSVEDRIIYLSNHWVDGGYIAMKLLLEQDPPPDGVVAFSDIVAFGAAQALLEQGLRAGNDIGLVGFDDIKFSSFPSINLTSITPTNQLLAEKALEVLNTERENPALRPQKHILTPQIVWRNSSGQNMQTLQLS